MEFTSYQELERTYAEGKLHPMDLKTGVANALNGMLEPVREYFQRNPRNLEELKHSLEMS
jgi:tyrosyl-tRNA synthetase